jgi:hypothetical protein
MIEKKLDTGLGLSHFTMQPERPAGFIDGSILGAYILDEYDCV